MCSDSIKKSRLRSLYTRDHTQEHEALHRLRLDEHRRTRWAPSALQIALMGACTGLHNLWAVVPAPWHIHGGSTCAVTASEKLVSARYTLVIAPKIMKPSTAFDSMSMYGGRYQVCKSHSCARVQA